MEQALKVLGIIFLVTIFSLLAAWPTLWIINYLFTSVILTALFGKHFGLTGFALHCLRVLEGSNV